MRKLSIALAAAALVLTSAWAAGAQTQGASSLNSLARNASPVHQAACARLFAACPLGTRRVCNRWGRCWCVAC
jgi:hypothetical protein